MAATGTGWFARKREHQKPVRALTASTRRLDLANKTEGRQMRALRMGWQSNAWNYRDTIGELRYAIQFLANSAGRMRVYVAAEPNDGESDNPVPLDRITGIPEQAVSVAAQALLDLGKGRLALKGLLKQLSTNISVAGECFLLGQQDPETGEETWTIRSVDELVIKDDTYQLREIPDGPQGIVPWVKLYPELSVVSRIWIPHPQFSLVADGPMKAMLDDCESLQILRRMIRSDGRSRLGRGILLIPDGISIKVPTDDDEDPQADPVFAAITESIITPISDEGVASAAAPIVIRGDAEALKEMRHLSLAPAFDEATAKTRDELIGIIATSFDLPKEVIQGVADLNHWSAWQVDDNTFRHHIEPHVIEICDALTGAYLRPYLESAGVPKEWARRMVFWYDPSELVTHPDRTADAEKAHGAMVISDEAYRREAGFDETDKPSAEELEFRQFQHLRNLPLNLLMEYARRTDPTLIVPPITVAGTVPGIKPGGVDVGQPALPPAGPSAATPGGETATPEPAVPEPANQPTPGPPAITGSAALTAAGAARQARLSRKLAQIDRDLRSRLQTATNAAMHRKLEMVGARLRSKVAKDETLRTKIAHRRTERVSAVLGREAVEATGVNAEALVGEDWSDLRTQYHDWTAAAQEQALRTAGQLAGLEEDDPRIKAAQDKLASSRDGGWELLATTLGTLAAHLLYNPDPNVGPTDWADLNPDTLVQTGVIRAALGVAGGNDIGIADDGTAISSLGSPVGQVGTGATITELLESAQMTTQGYSWEHGPSIKPFEPHLDLDGEEFASFDSEALANSTGFPDNAYYFPGDHQGCSCDFAVLWVPSE